MSAEYLEKKEVAIWAVFGALLLTGLALKDVWILRAAWVYFAVAEYRGASKTRYAWANGARRAVGDTLSEVSTRIGLMSKPGTRFYQSWRSAVAFVEIPLICAAFFLTFAWGPESPVQYWYLAAVPAGGIAGWLYWHFLHVETTG